MVFVQQTSEHLAWFCLDHCVSFVQGRWTLYAVGGYVLFVWGLGVALILGISGAVF